MKKKMELSMNIGIDIVDIERFRKKPYSKNKSFYDKIFQKCKALPMTLKHRINFCYLSSFINFQYLKRVCRYPHLYAAKFPPECIL